ncbi:MAG: hypothetical protein R3E32_09325 [Chitinophagales bacterium]
MVECGSFGGNDEQLEWVSRPITGKFEHISSDVSNYYFEGLEQLIGATSVHPFWSVDRQDWIAVGDLEIGERVKTKVGISTLLSKERLEGQHSVFNLEVYREHNFLVSDGSLLVHNNCLPKIRSIKHSVFNKLKDLGIADAMDAAMKKGLVAPKDNAGIVRLTATEMKKISWLYI